MTYSVTRVGAVLAAALATAFAAAQQIQVQVNGNSVYFPDVEPQQIDGQVMVPIRGVLEHMGATVNWDEPSQSVMTTLNGSNVVLHIGDNQAYVNGTPVTLDVAPTTMNDRTLVPMRFLADALGAQVNWNGDNNLVAIQTTGTNTQTAIPETTTYALHKYEILPVSLDTSLSSMDSHVGDTFTATINSSDTEGYGGLPAGTRIEGHIAGVRPMTEDMPAVLDLAFDQIILPNQQTIALDGSLISLDNEYTMEGDDGTMEAQGDAMTYPKMVFVGYGADNGTLVGIESDQPVDATILTDSLSGIQMEVPPDARVPAEITLPAGTTFGVRIDRDLSLDNE